MAEDTSDFADEISFPEAIEDVDEGGVPSEGNAKQKGVSYTRKFQPGKTDRKTVNEGIQAV
eukprot:m.155160 g.155160  ORF g.155160 m.155160 type:complete len:61 (+) comp38660_c0_seq2:14-196(+)